MNRLRTLFRATVLAGALPILAAAQDLGDRIDTTLVLDRGGVVELGAVSGEIRVIGSDRRDVRISASIERGRLELTATSARIALRTRSVNNRQSGARFDVAVPVGTRVQASTVSGRIEVRATQGEVIARSTSGSVEVREAKERVEVETVSGEIDLQRVSGRVSAEGVSARIYADDVTGELTAETVSGEISVRRGKLSALSAEAVSGSISYDGLLEANGRYRMNTHSGTVTLSMPANVGARLELETFSGRISSDFPLTMQPGETGGRRGRRMEFTLGDGSARIIAGSFSGNINIRRASTASGRE